MYKRLLITAKLKTNPIINDQMYLDGILFYASLKKNFDYYNLPRFDPFFEENYKVRLPVKRQNQSYLCSKAIYTPIKEYVGKWRKRFEVQKAEKYKDTKKVRIDSTIYKNYDMPVPVTICKNNEIKWVCIGDKEKIAELLKEVHTIGKKGSQGYGIIDRWTIEETNKKGIRVFKLNEKAQIKTGEIITECPFNPPYTNNKTGLCVYRRF